MLKLKKSLFFPFLGLFLAGSPAFGHFPDSVNYRIIINIGLSGMGFGLNSSGSNAGIDRNRRNTQFFGNFIYSQSVHIDNYKLSPKKLQEYVSRLLTNLLECSSMFFRGDKNMAEIINFLQAKQALEIRGVVWCLKRENEEKQGIQPPAKKALVISALPGETIPPEYEDLRPFLQRDGVILLSWAIWNNHKDLGNYYRFNWLKSCGKLKRYADGWEIISDLEKMKVEACPEGRGDYYYREGKMGRYSPYETTADTVFICAPELTVSTRPYFIQKLKETGVNVNFDFDFSLGVAKQLQFQKQVELIQSLGSQGVQNA